MPVSPADFALWARATGNKYPETAEEKFAAAPHAYEYAKNLGRTGQNAPGSRVGGNILYSHPESVQNPSPNSLFDASVTPDNDAPKVKGTVDHTLTSEHFVNQQEQGAGETSRARQIVDVVGKTALAAGTLAAGVALARNPGVQQAARSAGTAIKENAQNIGSRVSSFLGGFGVGQTSNPSVVRNSGDVTPPTTGQRYQQEHVPTATQEVQVAKGAPVGSPEKSILETKPVTESEVISTNQTFSPDNQATKSELIQRALAATHTNAAVDDSEYVPNVGNPYKIYGPEFERAFSKAAPGMKEARRAIALGKPNPLAGAPLVDPFTGEIRNPTLSVPGYNEVFGSGQPSSAGERAADFLAQTTGQSSVAPVSEQTSALIPNTSQPGYARYHPEGYEVSSQGDKRFSAMYAKLPSGQTVEQAYQSAKGTGKGQPAADPNFDYWGTYKGLWNQYFDANPEALNEIATASQGKVLTDKFANTSNNQARAIHEILTERGLRGQQGAPAPSVGERTEAFIGSLVPASGKLGQPNPLRLSYSSDDPSQLENVDTRLYTAAGFAPVPQSREVFQYVQPDPAKRLLEQNVKFTEENPLLFPVSRQEVSRPISKQPIKVPGANQSGAYTGKATTTRFIPLSQAAEQAPFAGAPELRGSPSVIRLAGARDIEAAAATQEAQGMVPLGPFASLLTKQEYQSPFDVRNPMASLQLNPDPSNPPSSNLVSLVSSGIDPRIVTSGEQNVRSRVEGYLGGKQAWMQKNAEQANMLHQQRLSEGLEGMAALKSMAETHPDEKVKNKAMTLTKQLDSLYDITQDPNLIAGVSQLDLSPETIGSMRTNELVQAIAPQLTLPGGEVIPTSAFYRPHKAVGYAPGSNLTQVQGYEQDLIGKQATHSNTQRLALSQLRSMSDEAGNPLFPRLHPSGPGEPLPTTVSLSAQEFNALPKATQNQLRNTRDAVATARHNLEAAKGNELLFHIPENILEGVNMRPVFSELTGEVSGFEPVPMEKTMSPVARHAFESGKGIGRADVGGVGRRREELQQQFDTELAPGSLNDPEPVMYKAVDSGAFIHPEEVTAMDIHLGRVMPVTGQTATAQRILGSGGRGFGLHGTSASSFDPNMVAEVEKSRPGMLSPEGLIYATKSLVSQGGGLRPTMGTRFDYRKSSAQLNQELAQAQAEGMSDVADSVISELQRREQGSVVGARENQLKRLGLGSLSPETVYNQKTARPTTRVATAAEKTFGIASAKKAAAQAALPESQTIPLEEPKHYIAFQESSTGESVPTWYVDDAEGYVSPARPSQQKLLFEQATRPDQFGQTELRLPGLPGKPSVRMTSLNMQASPTPFTRWTDYIDRALTVNPQTPMQWLSTAQEKALQRPAVYQPRLF